MKEFQKEEEVIVGKIINKIFPEIEMWVLKNNGTIQDAQDICQDAALILIKKMEHEKLPEDIGLKRYAIKICKNIWFKEMCRRKYVGHAEHIFMISEENVSLKKMEFRNYILYKGISSLPGKCKRLFCLSFKRVPRKKIKSDMGFKSLRSITDKLKNCKKALIKIINKDPEYNKLRENGYLNN